MTRNEERAIISHCLKFTNPFMVRLGTDNSLIMYNGPVCAYCYIMEHLVDNYPSGLIDISYLLVTLQKISLADATRISKGRYTTVEWNRMDDSDIKNLKALFMILLRNSDVPFDDRCFLLAFDHLNNYKNAKIRTDFNNVKFK